MPPKNKYGKQNESKESRPNKKNISENKTLKFNNEKRTRTNRHFSFSAYYQLFVFLEKEIKQTMRNV